LARSSRVTGLPAARLPAIEPEVSTRESSRAGLVDAIQKRTSSTTLALPGVAIAFGAFACRPLRSDSPAPPWPVTERKPASSSSFRPVPDWVAARNSRAALSFAASLIAGTSSVYG
jgi:hypothetical protein